MTQEKPDYTYTWVKDRRQPMTPTKARIKGIRKLGLRMAMRSASKYGPILHIVEHLNNV